MPNYREKYPHLLIPADQVDIHWQTWKAERPLISVMWRPLPDLPLDDPASVGYLRTMHGPLKGWATAGACCVDWLESDHPEHVFARIVAGSDYRTLGQAHPPETVEAFVSEIIRQFARIDTCEWARTMYEQRTGHFLTAEDLEPYFIAADGSKIPSPMPADYRVAA